MVYLKRGYTAHRGSRLMVWAVAEGLPLRLQQRTMLGRLAGVQDRLGSVDTTTMTALEASRAIGHDESINVW